MLHYPGDDIGVFLAVCEAGSFAAAATKLGLSSSAVAKAVARLEAKLAVRLFERTTRKLAMTEEGAIYERACRSARAELQQTESALRNLSGEPAGTVRVSLPPLFGAQVVAPALYDLCRRWPNLRYEISTSTRQANLIEDRIDLAVRIGDLPDTPSMIARRLGRQDVILCGSAAYFSRNPLPETIEDLQAHEVIGSAQNGQAAAWHFRKPDGDVLLWTPHARLLLDGSLLMLAAIRDGQGLGLLPRWLVEEDLSSGLIVPVLQHAVAGHRPVHAIWPASPVMLPRVRATIDAIVQVAGARLA